MKASEIRAKYLTFVVSTADRVFEEYYLWEDEDTYAVSVMELSLCFRMQYEFEKRNK